MNNLICTNKDFAIIQLEERVSSMLWPAYYLKLANGYWYNLALSSGIMLRVNHVGPVKTLNKILSELTYQLGPRSNNA